MKTKVLIAAAVLAVVMAFSLCAFADQDEVVFEGQTYCLNQDDCQNFATWGPTAGGYVVLYEADGHTISDYLWINPDGTMTFESDDANGNFALLPPASDPFLGGLIETGQLQQINQFFPGGGTRPLFILSKVDTPEPSTLLLFGPAALFLFGRARRFWRS